MAVFLRKLLGIGKLPDDVRAQVEAEGVVFLAEFLPVTYRFSGRIPGRLVAKGQIRSYVGSLVFTRHRVLGTLSVVPKRAGRAIDQRWDAPQTGAVSAAISKTGLRLELDIGRVDPSFSGNLSLNYKTAIPEAVLTTLPTRSLAFDVPAAYVLRLAGVPAPRTPS